MKKRYEIPSTSKFPSYLTIGIPSPMESAGENALWDYNRAREHDGLPPVKNFPLGTKVTVIENN